MTDMPDFDSMSPEDLMKWMESLAKRQGATEGLTTDADMDIQEVSADDERLAGKGDYVPYGWTAEKWKEKLAKEEAEKAAKKATQPIEPAKPAQPVQPQPVQAVPPPQPQPAPEPVAPAASAATPDFDTMSPEELMKWMESLAVRQGATEGLTTSADMQVAEVTADDERLVGKGDYVPFGWNEDKWKEKLAKDEADKAAKKAAQPTQAAKPAQPVAQEEDEELEEALFGDVLAAPSLDDLFAGNNLLADDEDDEELEEALAGDVLAAPSLDDLFAGNNLLADEEEDAFAAELPSFDDFFGAATDNSIPELDLSALEGLGSSTPGIDNPMDWLAGLAGSDEGVPDLDMNALSSLAALGDDEPEAETSPMDWLAGLADDGDLEAEEDTEEGSLAWLETLAKQEGVDSEELFTAANLDIDVPDNILDDGPGYEDFSFEQGSGMIVDADDDVLTPAFDVDAMDMSDPENWLEQLASAQSGVAQVDFDDEDDLDEDDDVAIPTFDEVSGDIREKINAGNVSPDEILLMFQTAFDEAGKRTDVDDYIDSDDDDVEEDIIESPVQAEIPDWLQEQMNVVPEEPAASVPSPKKGDTAEMMLKNLGLADEVADVDDLPDWLKGGSTEDTGDISLDIFDDVEVDAETTVRADKGTEEVIIADTEDTWVQAFQQEASGELEEWYEERLAEIEGEPAISLIEPIVASVATPVAAMSSGGLQAANLPLEHALEHGEAMLLPVWLGGDAPAAGKSTVMPSIGATSVDDMDWLGGDSESADIDMPDWLKEQVDDSVAPAEELPAWLAGGDIDIESVEEIPDWLRETMGEEEAVPDFALEPEAVVIPEPVVEPKKSEPVTALAPVQKSPAPVPRVVAVDVSATLQAAQQKASAGDIDGAMLDYEAVVRANQALEQVEKAVDKLATSDSYKRNPAVFRVLGDVRMRQGKLQEALDTYRRALNML